MNANVIVLIVAIERLVPLTAAIECLVVVQQRSSSSSGDPPANGIVSANSQRSSRPRQSKKRRQSEKGRPSEERHLSEERHFISEELLRQPDEVRLPSEELCVISILPFRRSASIFPNVSPRRRPNADLPQTSLPIRELSAAFSTLPPARDSSSIGRIPHLKLPKFKGRDGENVLFWLHQLEVFFVLYQV